MTFVTIMDILIPVSILVLAIIGISIYVLFFMIGKKWASWEA